VSLASTKHPLPRAIYETILRDEALHRRLGGLYFEWAYSRIDDAELARLGRVLYEGIRAFSAFWKLPQKVKAVRLPEDDLKALGWLTPPAFASVAREVVVRDILDPLATIGIAVTPEERADLLA
jgi:hypothetical protein